MMLKRDDLDLTSSFVAPAGGAEKIVAEIWEKVFDLDRVGAEDDFFELGGDSMAATVLAGAVSDQFGCEFKAGDLAEITTPRLLAKYLSGRSKDRRLPQNVVAVNAGGGKVPLFLVHGRAGITFLKPDFLRAVDPEQPIYLFQAPGYDGSCEPFDRVEDLAESYLETMLEIRPDGPWQLGAFCQGGWIAVEIAHRMLDRKLQPPQLILIDTGVPQAMRDDYRFASGWIAGTNIPLISRFTVQLKRSSRAFARRFRMLARTGHFVDHHHADALTRPGVRDFLVSRMKKKHSRRSRALESAERKDGREADRASESQENHLRKVYAMDAAALTSVKLEHAFRLYLPKGLDIQVNLLTSQKKADDVAGQARHPMNQLIPRLHVVVSGDTHEQAVASAEAARLIQRLLGESQDARIAEPNV
jgi:acyl carrier protein